MRVLIVEDEGDIAATIHDYLKIENIASDFAANGVAALSQVSRDRYDVILLDVSMPRMDGHAFCKELRQRGFDTPVLMLTARDTLNDKIAGFDAGTDDYLTKPFAFEELLARVRSLSRRRSSNSRRLSVGDLTMHVDRGSATRAGHPLALSPTGWTILETLLRASPNLVTRDELIDAIWGDDAPDTDSLKVHMHRLRQDVDGPFDNKLIETVPGRGFAISGSRIDVE